MNFLAYGVLTPALALLLQSPPASAPSAPAPAPASAPAARDAVDDFAQKPWFTRLGLRSLGVQSKLPVIDRVVLVPDEGAYLAEISRWTPKARWPVLFDDDSFAPRFIRAFKPSQVIRRPAGTAPADAAALRAAVDAAIARAWGGDPTKGSIAAIRSIGLIPPGIVASSVKDPSWTAAVALAAGRGQPLVWIEEPAGGGVNDIIDAATFATLDAAVREAYATSGLKWDTLGDDLDAFTLCRSAALRVDLPSPPGGRNPQLPKDTGPLSVTDALCRNPDGSRWGFAGQIFGDRARAASMAMCSLFLHPVDAWMFNSYSNRPGQMFANYSVKDAQAGLVKEGFVPRIWEGTDSTMSSWRSLLPTGINADILFVNSSGNSDYFEMEPKSLAPSTDIPILRKPVALAMIHSFSLQAPDAAYTVGGRWLDHGVYSYVGSVHEPFLPAFIPPVAVLERIGALTPFLIAGRHWPGDAIPQVWRIATIGDPLMTIPAPKAIAMLPGREPAPPLAAGDIDVRAAAFTSVASLKSASDADARTALASAMHDLVLIGDDSTAAQLWKLAKARGIGDSCARLALAPLFRAGTRNDFMDAWAQAKNPSAEETDMLWQLWAVDLGAVRDRAVVNTLKAALRSPRIDMDAEALLPTVKAVEGRPAAAMWVNDLIGRTADVEAKRKLAQLLSPT